MSDTITTREAFVEAIDENPDDFAVRRVYYDWMEERGDRLASGWRVLNARELVPQRIWGGGCWWFWCSLDSLGRQFVMESIRRRLTFATSTSPHQALEVAAVRIVEIGVAP